MVFFFSSRRRHTRYWRDWSSDVCSSDLTRWRAHWHKLRSSPRRRRRALRGVSRPKRCCWEIHMYTKAVVMSPWSVLGAALVACALFSGGVAAQDQELTVAYRVSAQGLDLSQPAGAHEL